MKENWPIKWTRTTPLKLAKMVTDFARENGAAYVYVYRYRALIRATYEVQFVDELALIADSRLDQHQIIYKLVNAFSDALEDD